MRERGVFGLHSPNSIRTEVGRQSVLSDPQVNSPPCARRLIGLRAFESTSYIIIYVVWVACDNSHACAHWRGSELCFRSNAVGLRPAGACVTNEVARVMCFGSPSRVRVLRGGAGKPTARRTLSASGRGFSLPRKAFKAGERGVHRAGTSEHLGYVIHAGSGEGVLGVAMRESEWTYVGSDATRTIRPIRLMFQLSLQENEPCAG